MTACTLPMPNNELLFIDWFVWFLLFVAIRSIFLVRYSAPTQIDKLIKYYSFGWPLTSTWHNTKWITSFATHAPSNSNWTWTWIDVVSMLTMLSACTGSHVSKNEAQNTKNLWGKRENSTQFTPTRNFNKLTKTAEAVAAAVNIVSFTLTSSTDRHEFSLEKFFSLLLLSSWAASNTTVIIFIFISSAIALSTLSTSFSVFLLFVSRRSPWHFHSGIWITWQTT